MINYNIIPTKIPGTIFTSLSGGDQSLLVRYFHALEPVHYSILNRPLKDLEVRQMVIAKAIDVLHTSMSSRTYYPFLVQPIIVSETTNTDLPTEIIWDMHISHPDGWRNFRLAKILRMSGTNENSTEFDSYTGVLRFVFSASKTTSDTEYAILYSDYVIDSELSFQLSEFKPVLTDSLSTLEVSEINQFSGRITFFTLDFTNNTHGDLFNVLLPPTDSGTNGNDMFSAPSTYEIADSLPGSTNITGDFELESISHGTGILTDGALNSIPSQIVSNENILSSLAYPFGVEANLTSVDGIMIPNGLFSEFVINAPDNEQPTGDSTDLYNTVWLSRIKRVDDRNIELYFSTYNPSGQDVEFAFLQLSSTDTSNTILPIIPTNNILGQFGPNSSEFIQGFGKGHVKLSSKWDGPVESITDLFNSMFSLGFVVNTVFVVSSTRISPFGLNRSSKNTPTDGQRAALIGSVGLNRRNVPLNPNNNNRYVTELDEGLGEQIDLNQRDGILPNAAIERFGSVGTRVHKLIYLGIDHDLVTDDDNFYNSHVLPRLVILLGREPVFGDEWYDGRRFAKYNGNSWQTP